MDTEGISKEILELRKRIAEIEGQHDALDEEAFQERLDLTEERQALEARLAELRGKLSEAGVALEKKPLRDAQFDSLPEDGLQPTPEVH